MRPVLLSVRGNLRRQAADIFALHSLLREFRQVAEAAFLAGYAEGRAAPLTEKERHLIRAFAIEKAAYEIVYEAANRPDWIDIPLRGLAALVNGLGVRRELADAE